MTTAAIGSATHAQEKLTGWTVFSAVMLLVVGGLNLINGFTAIEHAGYFNSQMVYNSNLTAWGWVFVAWGVCQLLAGALVFSRHHTGTYLGVFLAATSAVLWFFMIFSASFAALLGVAVSLMVVYGLTAGAHPDEY